MGRLARILTLLAANAALFLLLEGGIRLTEVFGWLSLPAGGASGFDQMQHGGALAAERRLYALDRHLLIRMRPDFEQVYPRVGVIRIVCLGDSSTFGMNVEEADTYPRQLAALLDEAQPGRFEVMNLGVPGYTSRQGLELLRREVLGLQPDVVTFAFGFRVNSFIPDLSRRAVLIPEDALIDEFGAGC